MSNQYQSKPLLTDALAGKLKTGDSTKGLPVVKPKVNYKKDSEEHPINIKQNSAKKHGYELLDVNTDFDDDLPKPDKCLSFTLCLCITIIFGTATYGAFLLFAEIGSEPNTGNSTQTNITNTTNFL